MSKEVILSEEKSYQLQSPKELGALATELRKHVESQRLYTVISNRKYVHVEGWQFAGGLLGTFPRVVAVTNLSKDDKWKWQAEVEIVDLKTDKVVGRGYAICSKAESKKSSFDEYAILSMAQTRAIGKAYRNLVGWVMKLGGFEGTPAEEMTGKNFAPAAPAPAPAKPTKKATTAQAECHECAGPLTEAERAYSMRLYKKALCRGCQKNHKR